MRAVTSGRFDEGKRNAMRAIEVALADGVVESPDAESLEAMVDAHEVEVVRALITQARRDAALARHKRNLRRKRERG